MYLLNINFGFWLVFLSIFIFVMFNDFLKVLDLGQESGFRMEKLVKSLEKLSFSVKNVETTLKNWPVYATSKYQDDIQIPEVLFGKFASSLENMSVFFSVEDPGYKRIIEIKDRVKTLRSNLNDALQRKHEFGPQNALRKAQELKASLIELRDAESMFIEVSIHKWKTAIMSFVSDLKQ